MQPVARSTRKIRQLETATVAFRSIGDDRVSVIGRRHFVILLPLLLGSCQTQPASKSAPQKPAVAEVPSTAPAKPAPVKGVMTRFSIALEDPAPASESARVAVASLS